MAACGVCRSLLGQNRIHSDGICPTRELLWCAHCGEAGHLPHECSSQSFGHVYRPKTLEELIPADVRERWDIQTTTPILWPKQLDILRAECEIADVNSITVCFRDGQRDNKIREMMKSLGIATVHKMDANVEKLRTWCIQHGRRLILKHENSSE